MRAVIAALLVWGLQLPAHAEAVIVTSQNGITAAESLAIFAFESHAFPDGTRVKMFVLPRDHATTRSFAAKLGTTPSRFHDRAERAFASGKLNLLNVLETDREVVRAVERTQGGIGYAQDIWACPNSAAAGYVCLR